MNSVQLNKLQQMVMQSRLSNASQTPQRPSIPYPGTAQSQPQGPNRPPSGNVMLQGQSMGTLPSPNLGMPQGNMMPANVQGMLQGDMMPANVQGMLQNGGPQRSIPTMNPPSSQAMQGIQNQPNNAVHQEFLKNAIGAGFPPQMVVQYLANKVGLTKGGQ